MSDRQELITQNTEMNALYFSDTEKIRRLDEIRKMKREQEKRSRRIDIRLPLPKPLFERQFTDVGDFSYLERHPETPEGLRDILANRRMTIDELTTDDSPLSERDALIQRVREYVENIERERSSSEGDMDLLARKRMPR